MYPVRAALEEVAGRAAASQITDATLDALAGGDRRHARRVTSAATCTPSSSTTPVFTS